MAILLGIDTGGTYTDAVLHDEDAPPPGIVAKAKALTTHDDLSVGIAGAIDAVLAGGPGSGSTGTIGLVALSTTLATNALVEGRGGRICLILIGFDSSALARAGLAETLGRDPVAFVAGGHDATGARQAPLDRDGVAAAAQTHAPAVDAFAVVAWFGTRNPEDEIAAREIVGDVSSLPVTCGHDLSAALNAPRRALTAALNARLTGMIAELIAATDTILRARGIRAPLMLVRGDGSLVAAPFARTRPIETILSGPAASLVGAAHLTGLADAVVSDIGGTTTDIGVLGRSRPALSAQGARVGGHQTMVEAVDMATHGLGGDSEVAVDGRSADPRLILGPRKVVPIALLATRHGRIVREALERQLQSAAPGTQDARFLLAGPAGERTARRADLRPAELALLEALGPDPVPADALLRSRTQEAAIGRLGARGLVRVAGFTPSDAAHVLGRQSGWDRPAALQAATLMARKRDASGRPVTPTPEAFAELTHRSLVRRSAEMILDAALARDGVNANAQAPLARAALDGHSGVTRVAIGLALPLIGLGAAAPAYYRDIAALLGTCAVVPPEADVANAVGAVVGRVRITRAATVTQPGAGIFRAHLPEETRDYPSAELARAGALAALAELARAEAHAAGAAEVELSQEWEETGATVEGKPVFVEATARVTATGRPRLGEQTPEATGAAGSYPHSLIPTHGSRTSLLGMRFDE